MFKYKGIEAKKFSGLSAVLYWLAQQNAVSRQVQQVGGNFTSEIHISILSGNYFAPIPAEVAKLSIFLWMLLLLVTLSTSDVIASLINRSNRWGASCTDQCFSTLVPHTEALVASDPASLKSARERVRSSPEDARLIDSEVQALMALLEIEALFSSNLSSVATAQGAAMHFTLLPVLNQFCPTQGISNLEIAQSFAITEFKLLDGLDLPQLAQPISSPPDGVIPLEEPEDNENPESEDRSEAHFSTSIDSRVRVPAVSPKLDSSMGTQADTKPQGVDERFNPIGFLVLSLLSLFLLGKKKR